MFKNNHEKTLMIYHQKIWKLNRLRYELRLIHHDCSQSDSTVPSCCNVISLLEKAGDCHSVFGNQTQGHKQMTPISRTLNAMACEVVMQTSTFLLAKASLYKIVKHSWTNGNVYTCSFDLVSVIVFAFLSVWAFLLHAFLQKPRYKNC